MSYYQQKSDEEIMREQYSYTIDHRPLYRYKDPKTGKIISNSYADNIDFAKMFSPRWIFVFLGTLRKMAGPLLFDITFTCQVISFGHLLTKFWGVPRETADPIMAALVQFLTTLCILNFLRKCVIAICQKSNHKTPWRWMAHVLGQGEKWDRMAERLNVGAYTFIARAVTGKIKHLKEKT